MNSSVSDLADSFLKASQGPVTSLGEIASEILREFQGAVNGHKSAGMEAISGVARSARDAADSFEAQSPAVAKLVRVAADHVERASAGLKDQSLGDMAHSVADLVRTRPKLFIGGSILAGFVLARLLRSDEAAAVPVTSDKEP